MEISMTIQSTQLRIDIVSDVMCPWCVIGFRQLAIALEATGVDHEIHWHPFELNPNMPTAGQDMSKMSQRNIATILTSFLMCRWLIFEK